MDLSKHLLGVKAFIMQIPKKTVPWTNKQPEQRPQNEDIGQEL